MKSKQIHICEGCDEGFNYPIEAIIHETINPLPPCPIKIGDVVEVVTLRGITQRKVEAVHTTTSWDGLHTPIMNNEISRWIEGKMTGERYPLNTWLTSMFKKYGNDFLFFTELNQEDLISLHRFGAKPRVFNAFPYWHSATIVYPHVKHYPNIPHEYELELDDFVLLEYDDDDYNRFVKQEHVPKLKQFMDEYKSFVLL